MISSTFQMIFHLTGPTKDRRIPLLDGYKPFDAEKNGMLNENDPIVPNG